MEQKYQTYMDAFLDNDKFGDAGRKIIQPVVDTGKGLFSYIDKN